MRWMTDRAVVFCFVVVLAGAVLAGAVLAGPAFAQAPPPQDPIAAALAIGETVTPAAKSSPTPTPANPPAGFSAKSISDLLNAPASGTGSPPGTPAPEPKSPAPQIAAANPLTLKAINSASFGRPIEGSRAVDAAVLKIEVLLDRAHAPPGVIDGRYGSNLVKAIKTFEEVRGLEVDGKLTRKVWDELGGDTAAPVFGTYTITAEDLVGPFYPNLSSDYAEQAKLPDLGYRSPDDMFAARFHMDPRLLKALNPGRDMHQAGTSIVVALVETLPIAADIARIDVDKGAGQVRAYDSDGLLVVAYPATIGSEELPSPSGNYIVRGVAPHPTYTYDPKKNFQQGNNTKKLILPPGPNNPVGTAFIALSKPTYGIHGTPDPTKIDKTHSHGCVRLTNWNAEELARLVKVGTPVNFIDKPGAPTQPPTIATLANEGNNR
jgi:lipoprotein-anchoring transpeptidase ErfK/SrfK